MAGKTTVKIEGLRELGLALGKLNAAVETKIAKNAVNVGGIVIRDEAKRRVPVLAEATHNRKPGTIKKNIRVKSIKPSKAGITESIVGVRKISNKAISTFKGATGKGGKDNPDDPYYWRWVHYGTAHSQPQPFLTQAFETKKGLAATAIADRLELRIQKEAADIGRATIKK
jgi:HK97 gp10 family phage protein